MYGRLCAAVLACAIAGACTIRSEKQVVAPASASDTCVSRGYASGTAAYDDCVARETARR